MTKQQSYFLSGRITDPQSQSIEGITVRAFDQDPKTPDNPLGTAITDGKGLYSIAFTEADFKIEGHESGGPDVFIRVFDGERLLGESGVKRNSKKKIVIDLQVDYVKEYPNEPWRRVFGVVRNKYGEALRGVTVLAFDRDLRHEELLGRATTQDGKYEIRYKKAQFRKAEKDAADIVVKVLDAADEEIHKTAIFYNAPEELEVNINLKGAEYKGPSEWEILTDTLNPLLEGVSPMELREDEQFQDVSFLAGESGRTPQEIGNWMMAHRLAERAEIKSVILYGFLRQGQPGFFFETSLADIKHPERLILLEEKLLRQLATVEPVIQNQLLEKAIDDNIIPLSCRLDIDPSLQKLRVCRLEFAANEINGVGKGTIGQIVALHLTSQEERTKFMEVWVEHSGRPNDFWNTLQKKDLFPKEEVVKIQRSFRLGVLTRNHLPLLKALNANLSEGAVKTIRDLARMDRQEWVQYLKQAGEDGQPIGFPPNMDGDNDEAKFEHFAALLAQRFERAYPTTSFSAKLARTPQSPLSANLDIVRFLDQNPGFKLDLHNVDRYLFDNKNAAEGIENQATMLVQLKAAQRIFKLSPKYEAVHHLLSKNIVSAQQIYFLGKERLVKEFADSPLNKIEIRQLYNKAENSYALVTAYLGQYNKSNWLAGFEPILWDIAR